MKREKKTWDCTDAVGSWWSHASDVTKRVNVCVF